MSALNNRLKKLESAQLRNKELPPSLTEEELDDALFQECKTLYEMGVELNLQYALLNVRCREFFSDEHWVNNRNHRLSVFLKFKQAILDLDLPNKERVEDVLNLGWRGVDIDSNDIDWLVNELKGVDMGKETPWLKGYLEQSGVS